MARLASLSAPSGRTPCSSTSARYSTALVGPRHDLHCAKSCGMRSTVDCVTTVSGTRRCLAVHQAPATLTDARSSRMAEAHVVFLGIQLLRTQLTNRIMLLTAAGAVPPTPPPPATPG